MSKVFSFINYKGGVGKTTTTYHIGCSLACHYNKKVLLIDIDPQTNLTFSCKAYEDWKTFKHRNGTILNLYRNYKNKKTMDISRCIWQNPVGSDQFTKIRGLDLLPCDLDLLGEDIIVRASDSCNTGFSSSSNSSFSNFEKQVRKARKEIRPYLFLEKAVKEVKDKYDYILIDCPPNLYMMTQNALIASDYYIITTIPEYLSLIGLNTLIGKVKEIGKEIEKKIRRAALAEKDIQMAELGGIIFVKVRLGGSMITRQHKDNMNQIKADERLGKYCFNTYTTELIGYSDSAESRLPVWLVETQNAKRAAAKGEYEKITEEFLWRFSK